MLRLQGQVSLSLMDAVHLGLTLVELQPVRPTTQMTRNGCVANRMRSALIAHRRDLYRYIFQAAMPNIRSMKRFCPRTSPFANQRI